MGVDDYHVSHDFGGGRKMLTTQENKARLIEGLKEDIRRNIPRLNMLSESGLMMLRVSQTDVDPMIIINVVEEDRFQFIMCELANHFDLGTPATKAWPDAYRTFRRNALAKHDDVIGGSHENCDCLFCKKLDADEFLNSWAEWMSETGKDTEFLQGVK